MPVAAPGPSLLVVVGFLIQIGPIGFDDVECKTVTQFHTRGAKDGAQGSGRPTLLSYDFADIRRSDVQAKDGRILFGQDFNEYGVGVID